MKKLITLLTILVTLTTHAQWVRDSKFFIDFGPKVMVGPSLMNSNVSFDTTTNYKHKFNSYGLNYGAKLALNFGQHVSVVGEYIFTNNTQNFGLDNGEVKLSDQILMDVDPVADLETSTKEVPFPVMDFKKMTLPKLKEYVKQNGLIEQPNKMKKGEIIEFLENM